MVEGRISFRKLFVLFLLCATALVGAQLLSAWTGPTATAPAGNVAPPINVGTTDQVKDAGLSVNALTVFGSQYIQNKLGINVTNPLVALDVSGTLRLGNGGEQCQAVSEGSQRYNSTSKVMEYCNGSSWGPIAATSSAVSSVSLGSTYTVTGRYYYGIDPAMCGGNGVMVGFGVGPGDTEFSFTAYCRDLIVQ